MLQMLMTRQEYSLLMKTRKDILTVDVKPKLAHHRRGCGITIELIAMWPMCIPIPQSCNHANVVAFVICDESEVAGQAD